ncbi:MAG: hypothetical protein HC902_06090 [Calothrix sp. SM1_5_4]|nr:hypothetical protein [Calothrix sp. SM1_5_4]
MSDSSDRIVIQDDWAEVSTFKRRAREISLNGARATLNVERRNSTAAKAKLRFKDDGNVYELVCDPFVAVDTDY